MSLPRRPDMSLPSGRELVEANYARMEARIRELEAALLAAKRLFDEALPKFNWGGSRLDANAIRLLNEVPPLVDVVLAGPTSSDSDEQ